MALPTLEWALVSYYASRRKEQASDMLARLVSLYAKADPRFDANDFVAFVRGELAAVDDGRGARDRLLREVVHYARSRHLADEPTATVKSPAPGKRSSGG